MNATTTTKVQKVINLAQMCEDMLLLPQRPETPTTAGQLRLWLSKLPDSASVVFMVGNREYQCYESHVADVDDEHNLEFWIYLEERPIYPGVRRENS